MSKNRLFYMLVGLVLLVTVVLVAQEAVATTSVVSAENHLRAMQADAARWTSLAETYTNRQMSIQADSARWTALAESYAHRQPAINAYAARWTGLAQAFMSK